MLFYMIIIQKHIFSDFHYNGKYRYLKEENGEFTINK